MTREERDKAIRILQWLHDNYFLFRSTEEDVKYATKLAIQELQKESCEDCISRQAVISIIQNWLGSDTGYSWGEKNVMLCTIDELRNLPSVSTKKTGQWEKAHDGYSYWYKCSRCGEKIPKNYFGSDYFSPYCPECGAKMEVVEE